MASVNRGQDPLPRGLRGLDSVLTTQCLFWFKGRVSTDPEGCRTELPGKTSARMKEVDQEFLLGLAGWVRHPPRNVHRRGVLLHRLRHASTVGQFGRNRHLPPVGYAVGLRRILDPSVGPLAGVDGAAVRGDDIRCSRRHPDTDDHRHRTSPAGQGRIWHARALVVNEWLTSAAVLAAIILPWALGGRIPEVAAFVPSALLILASGFVSTAALVMTLFDATKGLNVATARSAVRGGNPVPATLDPRRDGDHEVTTHR